MASVVDEIGGEPVVRALVERFYDIIETAPEGARILDLHFQGHGLAHVRPYRHRYVSTGEADQDAQLRALVTEFGALEFFCINDTTDDAQTHDPRLQNVLTVLQSVLPNPSSFEHAMALECPDGLQGSEAQAICQCKTTRRSHPAGHPS